MPAMTTNQRGILADNYLRRSKEIIDAGVTREVIEEFVWPDTLVTLDMEVESLATALARYGHIPNNGEFEPGDDNVEDLGTDLPRGPHFATNWRLWRYVVVFAAQFGDDVESRESVIEIGLFDSAQDAASYAVSLLGKTIDAVHDMKHPVQHCDGLTSRSEGGVIVGFTVERYDGEDTDASWTINGGLRSAV